MPGLRHFKVWVGGAILLVLLVCGVAAPLLAPRDPQAQTLEDRLRPPRWAENGSAAYFLGTDNLGRDMLSRIIYGSRISLMVGVATVIFAGFVGCSLGAIAGYFGRAADDVVGKISEIFLAFPFLLIAIAIMAFLGQGVGNLIMALMLCDVRYGDRHHHGSELELSRLGRARAYPDVGLDAERGTKLHQSRAVAHDVSWTSNFYYGIRHKLIGRWIERHFRSKIAQAKVA